MLNVIKDPGTLATTCIGSIFMVLPPLILGLCTATYGFNIVGLLVVVIIELVFVSAILFWVPLYADITNGYVIIKFIARVRKVCNVNDIAYAKYIKSVSPAYLFCAGIGNRGFFGVAAECMEVKGIGHCYFYSRRSRDLVLLVLKDGKKYLVAPRDVKEFLNRLKTGNQHVICEYPSA